MNILVCITPQSNSKRLIDKGAEIVDNGELHIMHMHMGENIFSDDNAPGMLEELFDYGKTKGGEVHFLSGNHFLNELKEFSLEKKIGGLVLGEPLENPLTLENLNEAIKKYLPDVKIEIVKRFENN